MTLKDLPRTTIDLKSISGFIHVRGSFCGELDSGGYLVQCMCDYDHSASFRITEEMVDSITVNTLNQLWVITLK